MDKVAEVAPGIATPFFNHWYVKGEVPATVQVSWYDSPAIMTAAGKIG